MGKLNKKFKKLITSRKFKLRDAAIVISQYLKDVHGHEISPIDIYNKGEQDTFFRNWYLAKAYYGSQFNIPLAKESTKPENPKEGQLWIDPDYNVYRYHMLTGQWITITEPTLSSYGEIKTEKQGETN